MAKKSARLKSAPKRGAVDGMRVPKTAREHSFCECWIVHYDAPRAARESGHSSGGAELYRRFAQYLSGLKEKKEKALVKVVAVEQKDILAEMAAIAFLDPLDYLIEYVEEVGGTRVTKFKQKPMAELSRGQRAAISKITITDGAVSYRLPNISQKHMFLKDLGQHLGLFNDKLIHEHRHAHLHAALSFKDVDTQKLARAEQMLLEAMGPEGRRLLGMEAIDAEYADLTP